MLPEPDLFASVHCVHPMSTHNDDGEDGNKELAGQDMQLVCKSIHSSGGVLPHNTSGVLPHSRKVLPHSRSVAKQVRRWYLVVIVMLYVGLVTSFCLNIALLVRTPDTPSHQTLRTGNKHNNLF